MPIYQRKTSSQSKSKRTESTRTVPITITNSNYILQLQQVIGNQATQQFLQCQTETSPLQTSNIKRADDSNVPSPQVRYNTSVDRRGVGILEEHPELCEVLDSLIPLAQSTAQAWQSFREGGYESTKDDTVIRKPTAELGEKARKANQKLARIQNNIDTGGWQNEDADKWKDDSKPNIMEMAFDKGSRAKWASYLHNKLSAEELTMLQQAFAFTKDDGQGTLFSLFNLPSLHVEHDYEMTLREANSWVMTPHEVIMKYSNNIGMSYEKTLEFRWAGGGASGASGLLAGGWDHALDMLKKEVKGQQESIIQDNVNANIGKDPEYSEKTIRQDDAHQFWLPAWFEEAYIAQFAAFAKAEYKHVLASGLPSGNVGVNIMTFNYGSHSLAFDLSEDLFQVDPGLPEAKLKTLEDIKDAVAEAVKNDPKFDANSDIDEYNTDDLKKGRYNIPKLISGELEADWDVLYKAAYNVKGTSVKKKAEEIEIDDGIKELIDPELPAWQPLVMADIYFDTGSAQINNSGHEALVDAIIKLRKYLESDPEAKLRFMVFGKASRIWEYLKKGETETSNNFELSELRAQSTLNTLQMLRDQMLDDLLPSDVDDDTEGDKQYTDSSEGLGYDQGTFWSTGMDYSVHKSKERMGKDKNDPIERGANIRISVRPTPLDQRDYEENLEKQNPDPKTIAQIAIAQTLAALNKLFNGGKSD